jgi:hypothetical protein
MNKYLVTMRSGGTGSTHNSGIKQYEVWADGFNVNTLITFYVKDIDPVFWVSPINLLSIELIQTSKR